MFDEPAPAKEVEPETPEAPAPSETPAETDSGAVTQETSDSEARASETAKKQAIELRQLKRQLKELQSQTQQKPAKEALDQDPQEPDLETFDGTVEDFKKAHADWKTKHDAITAKRVEAELQRKAQTEAQEQQRKADLDVWSKREKDAIKRNPDYNLQEAYQEVEPNEIMDGFLMRQEIGPDILWHLAQNPDKAEELRKMDPFAAVEELINLRNKLSDQIKGIKTPSAPAKPTGSVKGAGAAPPKQVDALDVLYG